MDTTSSTTRHWLLRPYILTWLLVHAPVHAKDLNVEATDLPRRTTAQQLQTNPGTVFWGPECYGFWSNWTDCNKDCFTQRSLTLEASTGCPEAAPKLGQMQYMVCAGNDCSLAISLDPDDGPVAALVRSGLHTDHFERLGSLVGGLQIWLQGMMLSVICLLAFAQSFKINWLPDICIVVPIAAFFAVGARYCIYDGVSFGMAANRIYSTLVSRLMNDMLIPISIYEGGYHLQRQNFLAAFGTGVVFAVIGTLFSTVLIAAMVKYSGDAGAHPICKWREALTYAAFIADVDPVATLSIFSGLQVDPLLATLVGGEATLNDPVALVIFGLLNTRVQGGVDEVLSPSGIHTLVVLLSGSIVLGLLVGGALTLFFRFFRVRGRGALEAGYFLVSAYASFCFGEYMGMSGIIVSLFAGICMGKYTSQLVDDLHSTDSLLNNAARLADVVVFILIGAGAFLIDNQDGVHLGLWTIIFCVAARAIMVGTLVPIVNAFKRKRGRTPIGSGHAFMIFHSGLRGGMTMMMALLVDPYWSSNQNCLVIGTIVSVIGMAYLCGCTGPFFLRLVGVPMNVPQVDGDLVTSESRRVNVFNTLDYWVRKWLVGTAAETALPLPTVGRSWNRLSFVSKATPGISGSHMAAPMEMAEAGRL